MVDCRPSPYTYNLNVLEPLATKKQVKGPTCLVQCCRCGAITEHAEDSRIVKVLKSGLNSWNYSCPNCGGLRFRLAADILEAKMRNTLPFIISYILSGGLLLAFS